MKRIMEPEFANSSDLKEIYLPMAFKEAASSEVYTFLK